MKTSIISTLVFTGIIILTATSANSLSPTTNIHVGEYARVYDPSTQTLGAAHYTNWECCVDPTVNCVNVYNSSNVLLQTIKGIFCGGS